MIDALLLWVALALLFIGVGLWFSRRSPFRAFWYGWLAVIVTGQIWNLLAPWHTLAQVAVFSAGLAGLWRYRLTVARWLHDYRIPLLALLLVWCLFANAAIGTQDKTTIGFDTGLYHIQSVRWIQTSAAPVGLGNLHERLAFNNGFSFYPALFMTGSYQDTGYGLAYGLLFGVTIAGFIDAVMRRATHWQIAAILLGLIAFECVFAPLYGLMTDPAIWLLSAVLFWEVIQRDYERRFVWLMAGVMVSIKMSAVILALGFALITLRRREHLLNSGWAALAILPAILRSIIVSGYALFPLAATRMPVSWAMPVEKVQDTADWIASWARTSTAPPEVVLNNPNWISDYWLWHTTHGLNILAYFGPALMTVIVLGLLSHRRKPMHWDLLAVLLLAVVYWFFSAPDIRFAGLILWLIPLTLSLSLARPLRFWIPLLAVLFVVSVGLWPLHSVMETLPAAPTSAQQQQGVYVALVDGQCWDAPLPCAPYITESNP